MSNNKYKKNKQAGPACRQAGRRQAGFTLIELILYVALVAIFMAAAIQFAWSIIYGRVKSQTQIEVNQNMRLASKRIDYEIRNASDVNSVTTSSISLANSDSARNPTIINLSSGQITVAWGNSGSCPTSSPCILTSNQVNVDSLNFTDLSSGNSKNIKFSLTISHNNPDNRQEWNATETYTGSSELRSF